MANPRLKLRILTLCLTLCAPFALATAAANANESGSARPVYVHMNGDNDFLESVVAVRPGQPVIFVNQDTGEHAVQGYDPTTGKLIKSFHDELHGSKGAGYPYATYKVSFETEGLHFYYCPIHARLQKVYHQEMRPAHRKGIPGYEGAMAGLIVVTTDKALLESNPETSHQETLSDFWGG